MKFEDKRKRIRSNKRKLKKLNAKRFKVYSKSICNKHWKILKQLKEIDKEIHLIQKDTENLKRMISGSDIK